jgi:hypothetical protein
MMLLTNKRMFMIAWLVVTSFFQTGYATENMDPWRQGDRIAPKKMSISPATVMVNALVLSALVSQAEGMPSSPAPDLRMEPVLGPQFPINGKPLFENDASTIVVTELNNSVAGAWRFRDTGGVVGRFFSPEGKLKDEFQVHPTTPPYSPIFSFSLSAVGCGDHMAVTWKEEGELFMLARIFSVNDPDPAPAFRLNDLPGVVGSPRVGCLSNHNFIFAWYAFFSQRFVGRIFSSLSRPVTREIPLSSVTDYISLGGPSIVGLTNGGFFLSWNDDNDNTENAKVLARFFEADGTPQSDEVVISTAYPIPRPVSVKLNDDRMLTVYARGFSLLGRIVPKDAPVGPEFLIAPRPIYARIGVAALTDGTSLVAWGTGFGGDLVEGCFFSSNGTALTRTFTISPSGNTVSVTPLANGGAFAAWGEVKGDGSSVIYGRKVSLKPSTPSPTRAPTTSAASRLSPGGWVAFLPTRAISRMFKAVVDLF